MVKYYKSYVSLNRKILTTKTPTAPTKPMIPHSIARTSKAVLAAEGNRFQLGQTGIHRLLPLQKKSSRHPMPQLFAAG